MDQTDGGPVLLFDSPEEGRRGLSSLGLRLRGPETCRSKLNLDQEEGYFSRVADEIILAVFAHMPKPILVKCALVCRRWKRLA